MLAFKPKLYDDSKLTLFLHSFKLRFLHLTFHLKIGKVVDELKHWQVVCLIECDALMLCYKYCGVSPPIMSLKDLLNVVSGLFFIRCLNSCSEEDRK